MEDLRLSQLEVDQARRFVAKKITEYLFNGWVVASAFIAVSTTPTPVLTRIPIRAFSVWRCPTASASIRIS